MSVVAGRKTPCIIDDTLIDGMERSCVAIRHVSFESLDRIDTVLQERGYAVTILEAGIDDLTIARDADLLVVLGGPIGVYEERSYPWIVEEIALIEARLRTAEPTLGICLGAQLIVRAAGARVYPGKNGKEIGWAPVTLKPEGLSSPLAAIALDGSEQTRPVLHWHGDTFDLPDGARLLASSDRYENQAFSIGTNVLGLQFHIEVDPRSIERWLIGHAVELATAGIDPSMLRRESASSTDLEEPTRIVLRSWIDRWER